MICWRRWRILFVPRDELDGDDGDCDDPTVRGRTIRIADDLAGEELLETLLHECAHAAGWILDERDFVEPFARDVARLLSRLGFSR
jgi:hypothetical protein